MLRHHRNVHVGGSRRGGGSRGGESGGGGEGGTGGGGGGEIYRSETLSLSSFVHGKHYGSDRLWKDVFR